MLLWVVTSFAQSLPPPSSPPIVNNTNKNSRLELNPLLTLQEAILLAMRLNPTVHNAELQRVVDKFALAVARNQFHPQLSLTGQALYQNGAKPTYGAFPTLTQLTPLGTKIATNITQTLNNDLNPAISSNATLSIVQPLLRGFGPAVTKAALYDAFDAEKNNKLAFKNEVMNVVIAVINAYYQLVLAHNSMQVDQVQLKDAQNTLMQTAAKVKAGKAAPADQVQQQASIANLQLSITTDQNNVMQANQNLLNLLGLDPNAVVRIDETISDWQKPLPSLDQSIEQALANNISYQQALNSFRMTERTLTVAQDAQKWQLNATAGFNQLITQNAGTAPSLSKSLTLDLDIPIHDLPRKQQLVNAKVALQQTKTNLAMIKRQLITDVTNAYNNLQFSRKQIDLYQDSIKLAQQSLTISKIKFNYGKATTFELTSLQADLTRTQLGFVTQQIQYLMAVENFYQLLGTTLQRWELAT